MSRAGHPADPSSREALRLADRITFRPREAAAALGVSERTFRSMLPAIPHFRRGGAVFISVDGLRRWVEAQCDMQLDHAKAERDRIDAITNDILASIKR